MLCLIENSILWLKFHSIEFLISKYTGSVSKEINYFNCFFNSRSKNTPDFFSFLSFFFVRSYRSQYCFYCCWQLGKSGSEMSFIAYIVAAQTFWFFAHVSVFHAWVWVEWNPERDKILNQMCSWSSILISKQEFSFEIETKNYFWIGSKAEDRRNLFFKTPVVFNSP